MPFILSRYAINFAAFDGFPLMTLRAHTHIYPLHTQTHACAYVYVCKSTHSRECVLSSSSLSLSLVFSARCSNIYRLCTYHFLPLSLARAVRSVGRWAGEEGQGESGRERKSAKWGATVYTHTYICVCIYIYIYIYINANEGGGEKREQRVKRREEKKV